MNLERPNSAEIKPAKLGRRSFLLGAFIAFAGGAVIKSARPSTASAREWDLVGTAGPTEKNGLTIIYSDGQTYRVDTSAVPAPRVNRETHLTVTDVPNGGLTATGVVDDRGRGTDNPGLSTGSHRVRENGGRNREKEKDGFSSAESSPTSDSNSDSNHVIILNPTGGTDPAPVDPRPTRKPTPRF